LDLLRGETNSPTGEWGPKQKYERGPVFGEGEKNESVFFDRSEEKGKGGGGKWES